MAANSNYSHRNCNPKKKKKKNHSVNKEKKWMPLSIHGLINDYN